MSWKKMPLCVLDTETTGLDSSKDRVWELAIVTVENGKIVSSVVESFNPEVILLDLKITEITGIRLEELKGFPTIASRALAIKATIEKHELFASYNTPFDRPFIENELARAGVYLNDRPWLDPLVWVRYFQKYEKGKKLSEVAKRLNIEMDTAHRALADATAAAQVMLHYMDKLPDTTAELVHLQEMWRRQQERDMAGWRTKKQA